MSQKSVKKAMHPCVQFMIEIFSARAGLHVKQHSNTYQKDRRRG